MRIVFMGTPDFSAICLEKLIASSNDVVGVFTQPDKPVGRKQILTPSQTKVVAQKYNIPVFQPEKIKGSNTLEIINELKPDAIIVVAYGKILPKEILEATKFGCINVHASLLPLYRGAAPIQWAVLNGDKKTGVCIMQMDEGIDTGDIILRRETEIGENETSAELFDRLAVLGASTLVEALELIENGNAQFEKQPQGDFGYAKMIGRELCPIDWSKTANEIHNQVRGLQTWPVAVTKINDKNLKIHKTVKSDLIGNKAGEIVDNNKRIVVSCGDGKCLEILELQLDGKKKMDAKSFLAGNNIEIGTILGE